MNQKLTSIIICFVLILSLLPQISLQAAETPWQGDGTENNPYLITSQTELLAIGTALENGASFLGKHFKVAGTIYCEQPFVPIGTKAHPFDGTFNGNHYTIPAEFDTREYNYDSIGLFGYIGKSGVVKNVRVSLTYITSSTYSGGIAGYNAGMIQDCYVAGTFCPIAEHCMIGAIAGFNSGTIRSCKSGFYVEIAPWFGGTTLDVLGGIAGENAGGIIESCYSRTSRTFGTTVGGIAGKLRMAGNPSARISDCFTNSTLNGETAGYIAGTNDSVPLINCYYHLNYSPENTPVVGNGPGEAEKIPVPFSPDFADMLNQSNDAFIYNKAIGGPLPILKFELELSGEGTQEQPYIISSRGDLDLFSYNVNNRDGYNTKHYLIDRTIRYNSDYQRIFLYDNDEFITAINPDKIYSDSYYSPAGTIERPFSGTLTGRSVNIQGLCIEPTVEYAGLLGVTTGVIKNINLSYCYVGQNRIAGGIAGKLSGATVMNCHLYYTCAEATEFSGGIAGLVENSQIINCSSQRGNIKGSEGTTATGGIAGYLDSTSSVINCGSQLKISGEPLLAGGICADNQGEIAGCYSTAIVNASAPQIGLLAADSSGTVRDCFYAPSGNRKAIYNNSGNTQQVYPRTTEEMTTMHFIKELNQFVKKEMDAGNILLRWWISDVFPKPWHSQGRKVTVTYGNTGISKDVTIGEPYPAFPEPETTDGHFDGWTDGTGDIIQEGEPLLITEDCTLEPLWNTLICHSGKELCTAIVTVGYQNTQIYRNIDPNAGMTVKKSYPLYGPGHTVKLLVWESLETMEPLAAKTKQI